MKRLEPFFLHTISTIVCEERHHIDNSTVKATLRGGEEYDDYDLIANTLDNPEFTIHLFSVNSEMSIYSFLENLLNEPFCIFVDVFLYFMPDNIRELEVIHWVESERGRRRPPEEYYTPPDETFRQERCVICLESAPNILYLDCMHIAVCSFCDNMKRTVALRKSCDICRAEISRRIKI